MTKNPASLIATFSRILPGTRFLKQTGFLFIIDSVANAIDYVFHVYLGRALVPGDFAVFQALNASLLIFVTAFAVAQPVVARFVAEIEARTEAAPGQLGFGGGQAGEGGGRLSTGSVALIRAAFGWSAAAGAVLAVLFWALRSPIAMALNLPEYAVGLGAVTVFFVLLRPVVAGALQGAQRFLSFGGVRLAYAIGRFAVAAALIGLGWGLRGAAVSLPAGQALAVVGGIALLGAVLWGRSKAQMDQGVRAPEVAVLEGSTHVVRADEVREEEIPDHRVRALEVRLQDGLRLSAAAFLAYAANTALLNTDLLWVNRFFAPDAAGAYAAAVLLRRVLLLLPGAVTVILYPRISAAIAQGRLPDREIRWSIALVGLTVLGLTAVYFLFGDALVSLAFGSGYETAGGLLGWMGLAIVGYSLAALWMNVFLATRPWPIVVLLGGVAILQALLLPLWGATSQGVLTVFSLSGWLLALGGGLLFALWLRPRLLRQIQDD